MLIFNISIIYNYLLTKNSYRGDVMMVQKNDMKEMMQGMRQRFEDERSKMMANVERVSDLLRAVDEVEAVISENGNLMKEVEMLRGQLKEEKEQREKVEMQLKEMSKLSASVAGKASQDELLKALRVFVNKSKRKKLEKRIAVKEMVLELGNANSMVFPEDLAAALDSLDDEQPEAKVVNVAGNYNDIHDNGRVRV